MVIDANIDVEYTKKRIYHAKVFPTRKEHVTMCPACVYKFRKDCGALEIDEIYSILVKEKSLCILFVKKTWWRKYKK